MTLDIRLAESSRDISEARRFWYDIYVTEMGRHKSDETADHLNRELPDLFDTLGQLFVARENGAVVGTVLGTRGDQSRLGYYETLYGLDDLNGSDRLQSSITNKLIVAKHKRSSSLAMKLAATIYQEGLRTNIRHNYIDCNPHLLNFFHRLGFREHRGWVTHKDYGVVFSLVLDLEDVDHLRICRSPLLSYYKSCHKKSALTIGDMNSEPTSHYSAAI